jgi:hypothetical protein
MDPAFMRQGVVLVAAALSLGALGACKRGAPDARDVNVSWNTASPPRAGEATTADVTLRDAAGAPVQGARLQVQAFMPHPGMAPVAATVSERAGGVYRAELRFTMAGPWTVLVKGTLADGRAVSHQIDIPEVRPAAQ